MNAFRPNADSEEAWGLTFPITLALASRLVHLSAGRIGDLFFEEWRAETYPDPVLIGLADLLLIAVELRALEIVGVDLRDERTKWRIDAQTVSRLRDAISDAWRLSQGLSYSRRDVALVAGGPLPEGLFHHLEAPVLIDLDRIALDLQRRAARVTAAEASDPLGEEITDWLLDARRSASQAILTMRDSPAAHDGVIESPSGPVSIRGEMFRALQQGLVALDATIERVEDLLAALRDRR